MKQRKRILLIGLGALVGLLALPTVAWAAPLMQEGHGGGGGSVFALIPLIIFIPVIGLLINLAFGKHLGETWVGVVAIAASTGAFVIALLQFFGLQGVDYHAQIIPFADWITIGKLSIPWAFQIDTLSVTMMLVVTGVGTLIHIYAVGYMHGDVRHNGDPARFPRFFVYLNLFLAAMLILVTGNNYLMMFVGWEGVGVCSFLLIGFWFEKGAKQVGNARAARKAFVANRVGDWAMLMAMFLIFWQFGTLNFHEVFEQAEELHAKHEVAEIHTYSELFGLDSAEEGHGEATHTETAGAGEHGGEEAKMLGIVITSIALLLLIGATGKSAQIPLFVWLPDAMAGPTPVSALIHAATMVTAGIYMITRSNALFHLAPLAGETVAIVGAATALFAATIAVAQFDIKKVLAYSTISQLGFMIAAVGLGGYVAGMFHLITHAFFKALLFLSSGSVIHAMEHGEHATHETAHAHGGGGHAAHDDHGHGDEHGEAHDDHGHAAADAHAFDPQDMRNMGGLWAKLPITKWVYLIGAIALAGLPPFAGFFSKDEILLDAFNDNNYLVLTMLVIAAFFTAFYMTRQVLMVFFGKARTDAAKHAAESPLVMTIPLMILAALSILGGGLNLPGVHSLSDWLGHTIEGHAVAEFNPTLAIFATTVAVIAIILSFLIYRAKPNTVEEADPLEKMLGPLFTWLKDKWYIDELYDLIILRPYGWLSQASAIIDWNVWHDFFHDSVLANTFRGGAHLLAYGVDLGFIDGIANWLARVAKGIAGAFGKLQAGYVRGYALGVFLGVVMVLGYFLIAR